MNKRLATFAPKLYRYGSSAVTSTNGGAVSLTAQDSSTVQAIAGAVALSFAGGALGLGLASLLQFFTISTLNFGSFSELAFSFALSPSIIATSLGFSLLMGLIGYGGKRYGTSR